MRMSFLEFRLVLYYRANTTQDAPQTIVLRRFLTSKAIQTLTETHTLSPGVHTFTTHLHVYTNSVYFKTNKKNNTL